MSNPIYIGKLRHKEATFDGEHDAIVGVNVFEATQQLLKAQAPCRARASNTSDVHMLTGLLFEETGGRLSPTHTNKRGKRYRYYISAKMKTGHESKAGWRIPAAELERVVELQAATLLHDSALLSKWIGEIASTDQLGAALQTAAQTAEEVGASNIPEFRRKRLQLLFERIILSPDSIRFIVNPLAVAHHLLGRASMGHASERHFIDRSLIMKRRGVEAKLVIGNDALQSRAPDHSLVELIGKAHFYLAKLTGPDPMTISGLAKWLGCHRTDVGRVLPLAFLSPAVTNAILTGRQPLDLTIGKLTRLFDLPPAWRDQSASLGI